MGMARILRGMLAVVLVAGCQSTSGSSGVESQTTRADGARFCSSSPTPSPAHRYSWAASSTPAVDRRGNQNA